MQITHLDLTPSLGRLLDPALVPSLHKGVFITGGEALKQDQINTWGDVGCLFNFYGPTECTIGVTVFPSVPKEGKPSNIGWQFDNVGSYVLAPGSQTPVLRGAVGELCISGKLVGKGYLNRPELTADCFPYLDAFGERVYRTGDLVRLFHDGSIDFLGRK
ncbi:peptide synthetase, partial [Aureobasidium melanogenum]